MQKAFSLLFKNIKEEKKKKLWVSNLISIKPNGHQDSNFHEAGYHSLARRVVRAFLPS